MKRSGPSWWLGWGWSHPPTSPPSSSPPLLLRPQRGLSVFALLSAAAAPADGSRAPFLSGLGWRGEERREGDGEVERWCQWKKRRTRAKGPKQTDRTSSDCHKDGLKRSFQILRRYISGLFPRYRKIPLNTQTHAGGWLAEEPKLSGNMYCTNITDQREQTHSDRPLWRAVPSSAMHRIQIP